MSLYANVAIKRLDNISQLSAFIAELKKAAIRNINKIVEECAGSLIFRKQVTENLPELIYKQFLLDYIQKKLTFTCFWQEDLKCLCFVGYSFSVWFCEQFDDVIGFTDAVDQDWDFEDWEGTDFAEAACRLVEAMTDEEVMDYATRRFGKFFIDEDNVEPEDLDYWRRVIAYNKIYDYFRGPVESGEGNFSIGLFNRDDALSYYYDFKKNSKQG